MDGNKMGRDAAIKTIRLARHFWPKQVSKTLAQQLVNLVEQLRVSVLSGDVQLLGGNGTSHTRGCCDYPAENNASEFILNRFQHLQNP